MKNFKQLLETLDLLTEDRIDFLKQQFKDQLPTDHDQLAKHKDSDKIIDHFAKKADPTTSKAHTQWILNQYKKKSIRQEDAPQIKGTLQDFETVKGNLEKKDINQYKDIGELRDAVATQKATVEKGSREKKAAAERKGAELDKMYDEDGVQGFKIPNKESSIANYGPAGRAAQTSWCTAANSNSNMFNNYKGGKYTMHFPNGEVLQFHHQSGQIKDKNDVEIQPGDVRFKDYEDHISKFIQQTGDKEKGSSILHRFRTYSPEEINQNLSSAEDYWAKNPNGWRIHNGEAIDSIAGKAKLTDEQFDRLSKLKTSDSSYSAHPIDHLHGNGRLSHDQAGKLVSAIKPENDHDRMNDLAKNPAVAGEHLDKLVEMHRKGHGDSNFGLKLAENPNLSSDHVDHLLSKMKGPINHALGINHALAMNRAVPLSKDQQQVILDDSKHDYAHMILASRKDLDPEIVDKLSKHKSKDVVDKLVTSNGDKLNADQLKDIADKTPDLAHKVFDLNTPAGNEVTDHAFNAAMKAGNTWHLPSSRKFTKEHADKMIDSNEVDKIYHVSQYPKLSDEQIRKIMDHPKYSNNAHRALLGNPKLKAEHLLHSIDRTPKNGTRDPILEHPNVNGAVLHKLYDTGNNLERMHILHHPAVQLSHFQKAVDDPKMHGAISSSPSAPPSMLKQLSNSPFSFVRHNIAQNKNTDSDTLKTLSKDTAENVADVAKKRIK